MARRKDALSIVESAYALHESELEWLRGVAVAARDRFAASMGLVTYQYFPTLDGPRQGATALVDADPRWLHVTRLARRAFSDPVLARLHGRGALVSSLHLALGSPYQHHTAARALYSPLGIGDFVGFRSGDASGHGLVIGIPLRQGDKVPVGAVQMWRKVAPHLAAAVRLRRLFSCRPEAILDAGGRILHASGAALAKDIQSRLRESARCIDRARSGRLCRDEAEALSLWQALAAGRWSLIDRFDTDGRRYVVAFRNDVHVRDPRALTQAERHVAERAVRGDALKQIASALGLSLSTVATQLASVCRKLGVTSRLKLFDHPLLTAHLPGLRASSVETMDGALLVCSLSAPQKATWAMLTDAERNIARAVLDGMATATIASLRGRSAKTVANQIASIYRKLGVRSRAELACIARAGAPQAAAAQRDP